MKRKCFIFSLLIDLSHNSLFKIIIFDYYNFWVNEMNDSYDSWDRMEELGVHCFCEVLTQSV